MTTQTPPPGQLGPIGGPTWDGSRRAAALLPATPPAGSSRGLAVASLVLSVLGVAGLGSVAGVVLGHVARYQDRRAGRRPSGVALAGLVVGYVGIAMLPLLAAVAIPVFLNQREKAVDADLFAALRTAASDQAVRYVDTGSYAPTPEWPVDHTATTGRGTTVVVQLMSVDAAGYCLRATSEDHVRYLDSDALVVTEVPCG